MFKNLGLQVRKGGMDHAAYMRHWLQVHAPLSEGVGGVRGYVVNEVLGVVGVKPGQQLLSIAPALDGIAQLWFDTQAAMAVTAQTPEAKRWFSDGANYLGARTGLASSERVVRALSAKAGLQRPRYKLLCLLRPAAPQRGASFNARWSNEHAEALTRIAGVCGYVQSTVHAVNPATNMGVVDVGVVDGVDELWFETQAGAERAAGAVQAAQWGSNASLLEASCTLLIHETVVIAPP